MISSISGKANKAEEVKDGIDDNSDLNKSTTICKVGDLEVFPKAFLNLETYTRP